MERRLKNMDNLSWKILTELQKNARITASEIGRRVGLTAPAVAERISKMEDEGVIQGYRTVVDYDKLGFAVRVFIHYKCTALKEAEIVKIVESIPQILEWYTVTGDNCMLMKVAVPTMKDLDLVLSQLGQYGVTSTSIILSGNREAKVVSRQEN
jgi:Lrp/AsnC family transcriptional regulator, leucine-responsive regulatory protein